MLTSFDARNAILGFVCAVGLMMGMTPAQAADADQPLMLKSAKPFADTVAGIKSAIQDKSLAIIFEANHQNMIAMVGGSTTPSVTIGFANPKMGELVLTTEPRANLEMPMRLAVRELSDGEVYVIYYEPSYVFSHYDNDKLNGVGEKMDKMVGGIVAAGIE